MDITDVRKPYRRGAIILAGGEGQRLRRLTRLITGQDTPKQFCPVIGTATLLEQTNRRVALGFSDQSTVTVLTHGHERFFEPLMTSAQPENVIVQPSDRGTAAAILTGLMTLAERDPAMVVAIFPSDHYVSDDHEFMRRVESGVRVVETWPKKTLLLGATPTAAEVGYGWIEAGDPFPSSGDQSAAYEVKRFWEKPSIDLARRLLKRPRVWWNTFVMVAQLKTLLELFIRTLPDLYRDFLAAASGVGRRIAPERIDALYRKIPSTNFSFDVLASSADGLGVLPMNNLEWSDLGEASRVTALLEKKGIAPDWLANERRASSPAARRKALMLTFRTS